MKAKFILALALGTFNLIGFIASIKRDEAPTPPIHSLSPAATEALSTRFHSFETLTYDPEEVYSRVKDLPVGAHTTIVLDAATSDRPWILRLRRNRVAEDHSRGILLDSTSAALPQPLEILTFEGTVHGGGIATITLSPTRIAGTVVKDGKIWIIEPIQKYDPCIRGKAIAYRERDKIAGPQTLTANI
jgi:hypothetical protein